MKPPAVAILKLPLLLLAILLSACGATTAEQTASDQSPESSKTLVAVIGTLHGAHLRRPKYSLDILEGAVRKFAPDEVFTEIPPDRLEAAWRGFRETGRVTERRVIAFPEFRDMLFPLTRQMDFEIVPVAAWTKALAEKRGAKLKQIENNPARAKEWAQFQAGRNGFNRAARGKWDDPVFIHSNAYDAAVETMQGPYERHFDKDLGAGGWGPVNAAHYALIDAALNRIEGQGKRVIILFGAWHKYKILAELRKRDDIILEDTAALFAE